MKLWLHTTILLGFENSTCRADNQDSLSEHVAYSTSVKGAIM
jgi:hypothetical protein